MKLNTIKFILFILTLNQLFANNPTPNLDFADHLFQTGQYAIAEIEYRRFLFDHGTASDDSLQILERIARCKYFASDFEGTISHCEGMMQNTVDVSDDIKMLNGLAYYQMNYFNSAIIQYASMKDTSKLLPLTILAQIADQQLMEADINLSIYDQLEQFDQQRLVQINDLVEQAQGVKISSPLTPSILSALIPGSGYLKLGYYQTGLSALLLNSLLVGTAVELQMHDLKISSGIVYLVSFGWYMGTISGTYQKATEINNQKYNDSVMESLDAAIFSIESELKANK